MSQPDLSPLQDAIRHEISAIRAHWVWFLVLGIITVLIGTLLIVVPLVGTLAAVWVLSILLIAGGITQFVGVFWVRNWSGFFLSLLAGVLYLALGVLIIDKPLSAAAALTLAIAIVLVVVGIFRIVAALSFRLYGWGWTLASGVISLLLGLLIWRQWPDSAPWVIGLFIGIEMIFSGWTWIMLALALRSLPQGSSSSRASSG